MPAMYVPPHFASDDRALARRLAREHAFAILMVPTPAATVSHLPLIWVDDGGGEGMLLGHVAKANPQWRAFDGETPAIAVFSGPHAYVSPNWYADPDLVPTWNYAAVHVHGRPRAVEAPDAAHAILDRLVAAFESDATGNWSTARLSEDRMARQLKGIVAFEMPVEDVETKVKMSQNRGADDIAGVVDALSASENADDRATAAMMRALNKDRR